MAPVRQKAFAHKVRSGCDSCKRRHLKCDEGKPKCLRCYKADLDCVYNAPKPLIFEPRRRPDQSARPRYRSSMQRLNQSSERPTPLLFRPIQIWNDAKSAMNLSHWTRVSGPWFSRYSPPSQTSFWTAQIPRLAYTRPAILYLVSAIVGLEQRFFILDTHHLTARAREIVHNYNRGLQHLTSASSQPVDTYVAPILCWLIETMTNNTKTGRMHLTALQRLLEGSQTRPRQSYDAGSEAYDIIMHQLPDHLRYCQSYSATSAACGGIFDSVPVALPTLLENRAMPSLPPPPLQSHHSPHLHETPTASPSLDNHQHPNTTQIRALIKHYLLTLDSQGHTTLPYPTALRHVRSWQHTVWAMRWRTSPTVAAAGAPGLKPEAEAELTISATTFLIATVSTLLATQQRQQQGKEDREEEEEDTAKADHSYAPFRAYTYLLLRFGDLLVSSSSSAFAPTPPQSPQSQSQYQSAASAGGDADSSTGLRPADRAGLLDAVETAVGLIVRFARLDDARDCDEDADGEDDDYDNDDKEDGEDYDTNDEDDDGYEGQGKERQATRKLSRRARWLLREARRLRREDGCPGGINARQSCIY
ncbi:uncharacterized protein HMPREF1541_06680 [Cyphellophora europaea CBS 101466]|uniref:Zn(2)-C6 fungal-type domain-containing protein n=1 Tax=Cyphellophora europaea (strain CBS 101466) TaxID=1220924 RepID=W2RSC1_CYPE1|nr:uncharacterized protein HMPREF1541_06680 [Cyphellophora europaea CBS 101466]ETN38643.1 hypothetical protein HMPREF1541_06680 [Cyphellophora europaea CBS 101466]